MSVLLPLRAATYEVHPLHSSEVVWTQTNCYVDVWIEVLHALGLNPLVGAAFTVATDFEGDQWTFFKYPPEDLRQAYGIDVHEMAVWRPLLDHIEDQLVLGRLLTIEVDSYYLPDTAGVSYGIDHVKSTIVPNDVDRAGRRMGYFHNSGYHELGGDDFAGVFRLDRDLSPDVLPPYTELVRLDHLRRLDGVQSARTALSLLRSHLERRPQDNPVERLGEQLQEDLATLRSGTPEYFHAYAFATLRQCGASAQLASELCRWLADGPVGNTSALSTAADAWQTLAEQSKSLQFLLARAARGRDVDPAAGMARMATSWQEAQDQTATAAR